MDVTQDLPGRWQIRATNFPLWRSSKRLYPSITYGWLREHPLAFTDIVKYQTPKGRLRTIRGIDTQAGAGFVWRGKGIMHLLRSRFAVLALGEDTLVIRFERTLLTPAGVDVLTREGKEEKDLRQRLQKDPAAFGLSLEEIEGLTWLSSPS